MRKSRFTEVQIMGILRHVEGGLPLADVCREPGISGATFYKWRSNYGSIAENVTYFNERNWGPKIWNLQTQRWRRTGPGPFEKIRAVRKVSDQRANADLLQWGCRRHEIACHQ